MGNKLGETSNMFYILGILLLSEGIIGLPADAGKPVDKGLLDDVLGLFTTTPAPASNGLDLNQLNQIISILQSMLNGGNLNPAGLLQLAGLAGLAGRKIPVKERGFFDDLINLIPTPTISFVTTPATTTAATTTTTPTPTTTTTASETTTAQCYRDKLLAKIKSLIQKLLSILFKSGNLFQTLGRDMPAQPEDKGLFDDVMGLFTTTTTTTPSTTATADTEISLLERIQSMLEKLLGILSNPAVPIAAAGR